MPPLRSGTGSRPSKRSSVRAAPCATGCPARVGAEIPLRPRRAAPCMAPRLGRPCSGRPAATSWPCGPCSLSRAFASPRTRLRSTAHGPWVFPSGPGRPLLARARAARGGCAPVTPLAASHVPQVVLSLAAGCPRSATLRGSAPRFRSHHLRHRTPTVDGDQTVRLLPSAVTPRTASRALRVGSRSSAPGFTPSTVGCSRRCAARDRARRLRVPRGSRPAPLRSSRCLWALPPPR